MITAYIAEKRIAKRTFDGATEVDVTPEQFAEIRAHLISGHPIHIEGSAYELRTKKPRLEQGQTAEYVNEDWVVTDVEQPEYDSLRENIEWSEDEWTVEPKPTAEIIQNLQGELNRIDTDSHSDRTWREYVIANPSEFNSGAVTRMTDAENEAIAIRAEIVSLQEESE